MSPNNFTKHKSLSPSNQFIFLHSYNKFDGDTLSNQSQNEIVLSYWNENSGVLLENVLNLEYHQKKANMSQNQNDLYPFYASFEYMKWLCNTTGKNCWDEQEICS